MGLNISSMIDDMSVIISTTISVGHIHDKTKLTTILPIYYNNFFVFVKAYMKSFKSKRKTRK